MAIASVRFLKRGGKISQNAFVDLKLVNGVHILTPVDVRLDIRKFFISESSIVHNLHLPEECRLARAVSAWKKVSIQKFCCGQKTDQNQFIVY